MNVLSGELSITINTMNDIGQVIFTYEGLFFSWENNIKNNIGRTDRSSGINVLNKLYSNNLINVTSEYSNKNNSLKITINKECTKLNYSAKIKYYDCCDSSYVLTAIEDDILDKTGVTICSVENEIIYDVLLECVTNIVEYGTKVTTKLYSGKLRIESGVDNNKINIWYYGRPVKLSNFNCNYSKRNKGTIIINGTSVNIADTLSLEYNLSEEYTKTKCTGCISIDTNKIITKFEVVHEFNKQDLIIQVYNDIVSKIGDTTYSELGDICGTLFEVTAYIIHETNVSSKRHS